MSLVCIQAQENLETHASFHSINILAPHKPLLPLSSDAMLSQMFDFSSLRSFFKGWERGYTKSVKAAQKNTLTCVEKTMLLSLLTVNCDCGGLVCMQGQSREKRKTSHLVTQATEYAFLIYDSAI